MGDPYINVYRQNVRLDGDHEVDERVRYRGNSWRVTSKRQRPKRRLFGLLKTKEIETVYGLTRKAMPPMGL